MNKEDMIMVRLETLEQDITYWKDAHIKLQEKVIELIKRKQKK